MKKILIAGLFAAVGATPGFAADAVYSDPIIEAPIGVYDWSGFYVGVQVGALFSDPTYVAPNVSPDEQEFDADTAFVGGVHVGANYQMGQFVFGIEGDIEGSSFDADDADAGGVVDTIDSDWQGSIRGRAGFAIDRTLIYATAGWAFMHVDYGLDASAPGGPHSESDTLDGYTVGGGVEYAFTQNITARAEYRFSDFDETRFSFDDDPINARDLDIETHAVRVGLSYKF